MLDLKNILNNPKEVSSSLLSRGYKLDLKFIEDKAQERKKLIQKKEQLASDKNVISDSFRTAPSDAEKQKLMKQSKNIDDEVHLLKSSLQEMEDILNNHLLHIPNLPHKTCPIGESDKDNKLLDKIIEPKTVNTKEHADILESLKMISFEEGVKITQSRFVVLKGKIASLHRALINFMLSSHIKKTYIEHNVPYICNSNSLMGTGQLPKFEDDLFKISNSNLYLIPTAEVPLTNIYRDVLINHDELPIKLTAHTPCFRSEAGSYGRDTKGLIRQHQFEKIELFKISDPGNSMNELEGLLENAEEVLKLLELPYQVVQLCAGDIGFSSCKTYDIEVWMPSQNKYREISSCSNFGDFQARRSNIKFKSDADKHFVHTINGSGLAVGRALIALLENRFDGTDSIILPKALEPYFGSSKLDI